MAYLRAGLFAEGKTDYNLLLPLLRRLIEQLCREEARGIVEVAEVEGLDAPGPHRPPDRATRILEAARGFWGGPCILFVHADGGGDPERSAREQVAPAMKRIAEELQGGACVAVIPVREIEAWALTDGDALRRAFGTTLGDEALRIARRPRDVERLPNPKEDLRAAYEAATGPSRRRRETVGNFYTRIGESVDLAKLREVGAFQEVEQSLREALRGFGLLTRG